MIRFFFLNPDAELEEFTDRVNLAESSVVLTTQAEQGSVATSSIVVDDPLGDWDIKGHRTVYVYEDTAPFDLVYWGWAADRKIRRAAPFVETARQWEVALTDINTPIARRIMTGNDCNRPAETDVERLQWLTATSEQNFIDDVALLDTSGPVAMDKADYRYQYATQIYDDCSQASGKNWFLYPVFDGSDWVMGFAYMFGESTEFSADIRISNDLDDADNVVTFLPGRATTLTRDPSRVFSGVSLPFDGGTAYQQNAGTVTAFARRDTSMPMVNVKTVTKANARATRILNTINTEEDVIETSIMVPPEQVNDVMPGQRIEAKYVHLPGYEDFSWMRVLARTVTFLTPAEYGIDLTLSSQPAITVPFPIPGDTVDGYSCSLNGYVLPWCSGLGDGALVAGPILAGTSQANSTETVKLYDGCIYRFSYTFDHQFDPSTGSAGDNDIGAAVGPGPLGAYGGGYNTNPQASSTRFMAGHASGLPLWLPSAVYAVTFDFETGAAGNPCQGLYVFEGGGVFAYNVVGSSATCVVTYISGPDPRFEDLLPCPDPTYTVPT